MLDDLPEMHSRMLQNNPNSTWHTVHQRERREGGKLSSKSETKLYVTYHSVLTQELNFLGMQLLCKLRDTLPRIAVHSENQITVWQCHFSYLNGQYNTHLSVHMCRCCIQSFCL